MTRRSTPNLPILADPFASHRRPVLAGISGAVSAAHPLAAAAAQEILSRGGSAVDALIAAQAVLCVVAPDACGLGGDVFCLVRAPDGVTTAVNGAGASPAVLAEVTTTGGASVTVPGIVDAWDQMAERWGRLPMVRLMEPASRLARGGFPMSQRLARSVEEQRARLLAGGAGAWVLAQARPGEIVVQNELAQLLDRLGKERSKAFYAGDIAAGITRAVAGRGGAMTKADLSAHHTVFAVPVETTWRGLRVLVQPPMSQGILLSMCLDGLERLRRLPPGKREHAAVELTEASFAHRDRIGEGQGLLEVPLEIDLARAARRGGPRAYLHTAGVAVTDRFGMTVSSLVSVFDDFGSGVFVPEGGFVLNNRAGGFTKGANAAAPGKRPVHTLAPILVETPRGPLALATPGADGQIQTLLQVLVHAFADELDLAAAIDHPRWRSENGKLLVEEGHPALEGLRALGHDVDILPAGHMKFGAVVCTGHLDGAPVAIADWRRETWAGVL